MGDEETPAPTPEPASTPQPQFKLEDISKAVSEGMRNISVEAKLPAPPATAPKYEWDADDSYWLANDEDAKKTNKIVHERMTKYTRHLIDEAVKPYKERLDQLEGGLNYIDFAKANDEKFMSNKDQILALAKEEGCSFKTARRLWEAQQAAKATTPPVAPSKPVPPASASHPKNTSVTPSEPTRKFQRVRDIMKEARLKGEIYKDYRR